MATTRRAIRIEREENITALLLDIVSAVEVLALLTDDDDEDGRRSLEIILERTIALKHAAIARRNGHTKPAATRQDEAKQRLIDDDTAAMERLAQFM